MTWDIMVDKYMYLSIKFDLDPRSGFQETQVNGRTDDGRQHHDRSFSV